MSECKTVNIEDAPFEEKVCCRSILIIIRGYRDQETMKTIRHEGLNIYIYANPRISVNATSTLLCRKGRKQSGAGG